jgi:ubiquinone/menaquinone biosynthesis C-methylase UbiE
MAKERGHGHGHGHGHHHHERSQDYAWEDDMAAFFLKQARHDAQRRYPPIAAQVARLVGEVKEPTVLDLGCGPALLLPEIARVLPGARLVGIDPSGSMLELARRVIQEAGPGDYQLKAGKAEDIPLEDGSVHVLVSLKNLHEWEDAPKGMSEVMRVLRPGGTLLLQDANRAYPYWRLRLLVGWLRLTGRGISTHSYLGPYPDAYRPHQVEALLSEAGLRVEEADRRSVELKYVARRAP